MFSKPRSDLVANTYDYEMEPLVKATGFREYDARWLFGPDINLLGIQALGLGLGTYIQELGQSKIVVGHDYRSYSMTIKNPVAAGIEALRKVAGVSSVTATGPKLVVEISPGGSEVRDQIVSTAVNQGLGVLEFSAERVSLEEIFLQLTTVETPLEGAAS